MDAPLPPSSAKPRIVPCPGCGVTRSRPTPALSRAQRTLPSST